MITRRKSVIMGTVTAIVLAVLFLPVVSITAQSAPTSVPSSTCPTIASVEAASSLQLQSLNATLRGQGVTVVVNMTGLQGSTDNVAIASLRVVGTNATDGRTVLSLESGAASLSTSAANQTETIRFSLSSLKFYVDPALAQKVYGIPLTQLSLLGLRGTLYVDCATDTATASTTATTNIVSVVQGYLASRGLTP